MRGLRFIIPVFILLMLSGCAEKQQEAVSAVGFRFDTVITITGYCEQSVVDGAVAECERYERLFSRTIEGSDVWNINNAGGEPVEVSAETAELLSIAQEVSAASDGAFDITIAPATMLWDFGGAETVPDAAALSEAAAAVDWTRLRLDGQTVTLPAGMAIDLGGIAKGYAADKTAEYLTERGVECAILNFGGNTYMLGRKPDDTDWVVGIQSPGAARGEYLTTIKLTGGSAVTSGTYERSFEKDGVLYHHILDPDTGLPVWNGLESVTVVHDSSAVADALSTACFVLGTERGMELMRKYGAEGVFVTDSGTISMTDELNDD